MRRSPSDALANLPTLPTDSPQFVPTGRYTQERHNDLDLNPEGFLWPTEEVLAHEVVRLNEHVFAWDESEKGAFTEEYFDPIVIPTVEHIPWSERNIPVPPGIRGEVIQYIKDKIASGVYEPSNSSYRSSWFCVPKKNGKICLVHNLQPLNRVTIKDAAVPPLTDHMAEAFGGASCYATLDLFVAFDQRRLDVRSRDLTTFVTPLGTYRLMVIPMGWTDSFQIMHGDATHALRNEIPDYTIPYADDVPIRGPRTRYKTADGNFETIAENPGI